MIVANTNSEMNVEGCLVGDVNKFLRPFEAQKRQMLKQIEATKQYWRDKIEEHGASYVKLTEAVKAITDPGS